MAYGVLSLVHPMQTTAGPRRRWGALFALSILLMGALLMADVNLAESGRSSRSIDSQRAIGDDDTVTMKSIQAGPGDVVRVQLVKAAAPFSGYTFYAVEGGTGEAFLRGETPEHIYAQRAVSGGGHAGPVVFIERPEAPSEVPKPDRLDLVWVLTYTGSNAPPTDPGARAYYDEWVHAELTRMSTTPEVASAASVRFHEATTWGIYLLGVSVVVTGALWMWGVLVRDRQGAAEGPASAGMAMLQTGGGALGFLRSMLVALALPLVYVAWVSMFFFTTINAPGPSADWTTPLVFGAGLALMASFVAWATAMYAVLRADRRWRRHTTRPLPIP